MITVDTRLGRYRDNRGRAVPLAKIDAMVNAEQQRLDTTLARLTDALLQNQIRLIEWQSKVQAAIKDTAIRMTLFGNFGQPLDSPAWGAVGSFLRREYQFLRRFAVAIADGELTPAQIKARARLYAGVTRRVYERARKRWHVKNGFGEAKRVLDPQAQHCPECPLYATDWTAVENIVPVGAACSCGGRCRCKIMYRRSLRRMNQISQFADAILSEEDNKEVPLGRVLDLVVGKLKLPSRPKPRGFGEGRWQ